MAQYDDLYAVQVAGLLHDFGKFCHKYNGGKVKHNLLSGILAANHKELMVGANTEKVINLILKHHDLTVDDFKNAVGSNVEPNLPVTSNDVKTMNELYNNNANSNLVRLLRTADGFSASGDRASETGSNKGTHAEYALIWSPIAKALGHDDIAVKSNSDYKVIRYVGNDDTKATVLSNDSEFETSMRKKYESIIKALPELNDIEDLNALLEKEWSTVNPNTWRSADSKIGNTTTSLYDHSKTTAAIAGCLYVNDEGSGVDIVSVHLNGTNDLLHEFIISELNVLGLYSMCIISKTKNDVLFMYPHNKLDMLKKDIADFNKMIFTKYGETLDYKVACCWQFRDCNDTFNERFDLKKYGVLDVMNIHPDIQEEKDSRYFDILVGYKLTNFEYVINHLMDNNDSISKVATSLRIFEMFADDVEKLLKDMNVNIVELSLDSCYFMVKDINEYYMIARRINECYQKYVLDSTGFIISNVTCDKYCDNLARIKSQLKTYYDNRDEKESKSYIKIRKNLYQFGALSIYLNVKKRIADENVSTAALVKLLKIMSDLVMHLETGKNEYLVALSRLNRLIANEKIDVNKTFEKLCLSRIYNNEKDEINSANLKIYYQAVYDTIHKEQ